jgi:hypothetical protein
MSTMPQDHDRLWQRFVNTTESLASAAIESARAPAMPPEKTVHLVVGATKATATRRRRQVAVVAGALLLVAIAASHPATQWGSEPMMNTWRLDALLRTARTSPQESNRMLAVTVLSEHCFAAIANLQNLAAAPNGQPAVTALQGLRQQCADALGSLLAAAPTPSEPQSNSTADHLVGGGECGCTNRIQPQIAAATAALTGLQRLLPDFSICAASKQICAAADWLRGQLTAMTCCGTPGAPT